MLLRSIELNDFCQYRGRHVVDLSLDPSSDRNIVLICGPNGAGKTTLLTALKLALFGRMASNLREGSSYSSYMSSCVNRFSAQKGALCFSVSVSLDVGIIPGNSDLRVTREWHLRSDGVFSHEKLTLHLDDREQMLASEEDAQMMILDLLPYGIADLVFFDGEKLNRATQLEFAPREVRDAIEGVLGVGLYKTLRDDLRRYQRRLSPGDDSDDSQLKNIVAAIDTIAKSLDDNRVQQTQLHADLAEEQDRLRTIQTERLRTGGRPASEREKLTGQLSLLQSKRALLKAELVSLVGDSLPVVVLADVLTDVATNLDEEARAQEHEESHRVLHDYRSKVLAQIRASIGDKDGRIQDILDSALTQPQARRRHIAAALSPSRKLLLSAQIRSLRAASLDKGTTLLQELSSVESGIRRIHHAL
ncbi:MAG: AAA family ATPase, partial [Bacillota bacterium]|nr:AAA family ATPase [Bacillota bacterium]